MTEHHSSAPIVLEIAVDSLADALTAADLCADSLELCSALEQHGLTAEPAIVREVARRTRIPVLAMLRPRPGPFLLPTTTDVEAMVARGRNLLEAGASGLVFGM